MPEGADVPAAVSQLSATLHWPNKQLGLLPRRCRRQRGALGVTPMSDRWIQTVSQPAGSRQRPRSSKAAIGVQYLYSSFLSHDVVPFHTALLQSIEAPV
jgi:hypothetical protein